METGGRRRTGPGGCEPGTGSGERGGERSVLSGAPLGQCRRGNGKSPGLSTPPVPSFCPGGRRPSVPLSPGPARTALEPSALPGRSAQLTQDQAASHPHPPGSRSAVAVAAGGGASRWAEPGAPLPHHCSAGPAPAAAQSI